MSRNARISIVLGLTAIVLVVFAFLLRIPQNPTYHQFADQRAFFHVPRFMDVASNAPFVLVGLLG